MEDKVQDALERSRTLWGAFTEPFAPEETDQLRDELLARRAEIDAEIARLDFMRRAVTERMTGPGASPGHNGTGKPTKVRAVLLVLAERPDSLLALADLHNALAERGWYEGGQASYRQLQTNVSKLVKRRWVERGGPALYRITAAGLAEAR